MAISELLMQGLSLMLLGMGVVFTFLILLVFSLIGMSRLARLLEGETMPAGIPVNNDTGDDENLPVVIAAAVTRYRRRSTD